MGKSVMRKKETAVERHERQKEKLAKTAPVTVEKKIEKTLKEKAMEACIAKGYECDIEENVLIFKTSKENEVKDFLIATFGANEERNDTAVGKKKEVAIVPFSYGFRY